MGKPVRLLWAIGGRIQQGPGGLSALPMPSREEAPMGCTELTGVRAVVSWRITATSESSSEGTDREL